MKPYQRPARRKKFQTTRTATQGLFTACESLDVGLARAALKCGADVEAVVHSHTPLLAVVRTWRRGGSDRDGSAFALVGLLSEHGVDLDRARPPSAPALSRLVDASDGFLRRALLAAGANAQAADCHAVSVLHEATAHLCVEAMTDLIDAGASVNALDAWGRSPLHYLVSGPASYRGPDWDEMVQACMALLLSNGADLSFRDTCTPNPGSSDAEPGAELLEQLLSDGERELFNACMPDALELHSRKIQRL